MTILKNTTEGIYPYQKALYDKIQAGGFKHGEIMILSAGRQLGKSMLNQMYRSMMTPAKFSILDRAQVDGATWYTVSCVKEVSMWLRDQSKELQYSHIDKNWTIYNNKFDIHEKLYTILALKWS